MPDVVSGAPADVGTATRARASSEIRGPSRVPPAAHTHHERIRTVVVDSHEDIARLVASRIATLIREKQATGNAEAVDADVEGVQNARAGQHADGAC